MASQKAIKEHIRQHGVAHAVGTHGYGDTMKACTASQKKHYHHFMPGAMNNYKRGAH